MNNNLYKKHYNGLLLALLIYQSGMIELITNNTQFSNNKNNCNISKYNSPVFGKTNSASLRSFGPLPTSPDLTRDFNLNVSMKPRAYNYIRLTLRESNSVSFTNAIFGNETPPLFPGWDLVKQQLEDACKTASIRRGLEPNAIHNLFLTWLRTENGFQIFKNVFTGGDLRNNTYKMPLGYDSITAEQQFRQEGAILQIPFSPLNAKQTKWKVDYTDVKIFPQTENTVALKFYYQNLLVKGGKVIKVPPLLKIKLSETPPTRGSRVQDLLQQIIRTMQYNFNYADELPVIKDLIRIPFNEYSNRVSLDWKNPTIININFYSWQTPSNLYISKPIRLYETGPI